MKKPKRVTARQVHEVAGVAYSNACKEYMPKVWEELREENKAACRAIAKWVNQLLAQ